MPQLTLCNNQQQNEDREAKEVAAAEDKDSHKERLRSMRVLLIRSIMRSMRPSMMEHKGA